MNLYSKSSFCSTFKIKSHVRSSNTTTNNNNTHIAASCEQPACQLQFWCHATATSQNIDNDNLN
jgi:hypothetical protein